MSEKTDRHTQEMEGFPFKKIQSSSESARRAAENIETHRQTMAANGATANQETIVAIIDQVLKPERDAAEKVVFYAECYANAMEVDGFQSVADNVRQHVAAWRKAKGVA